MINPKMYQKPVIGIGIAALVAVLCLAALASDSARIEKPAAVDAEQYADFIENEVFDIQDLAEGAEIQRRMFNRITPQGISWVQPMFPPVVPFDAENFDEKFLDELLGEDKNSVAIYPLSLTLDPKTRETLVFNAEGKLIATIPADRISREWPEDADPARVTLQLDLLPSEDVEPYLYTESRIADYAKLRTAKSPKTADMVLRSLGASEFGIAGFQRLTNGSMRITVTNGADTAEVYSYTVWHTSTITTNEWVDEYGVTNITTNTLWTPVSPPFNGIESEWECLTTNLALSGGVGVYEDANIASNARVRFYAVANRLDSDGDGLTDGTEIFIHRTDPGNPDTDGDGWSDSEELSEETDPLDRFSATKLARGVVLNEVLYDAAGTDLGKEWIELYSAGRYPVDVGGFVVQVADTAYTNAYVFPSNTWIDPGRFLLLGGSLVTNRDLEVDFTMPNRFTNDATAAVRLAAEMGTNTVVADCLMYGGNAANFNPNGLDTTGWISTNARSAGAGNSLIRLFSGHDTDQVLDWKWQSSPVPGSSDDIPDSDGDGLTDQEELTGSQNPYGEPTDRHNADSDGDGLSDFYECNTSDTNPNTWATDGDIFPWPPPSGAVSNWWGSDSYELANGWDPQIFDENTNGIPDSWEMAFPGTNLYADADNDGISNYDELLQNSDPNSSDSTTAQPFVLRYESSIPGWANDGMQDVGLKGWVNVYFEQLKTSLGLCAIVTEGMTQEQFKVEWHDVTFESAPIWINEQKVLTGASADADTRPYLHIEDLGLHPDYTSTLGGEYFVETAAARLVADHNHDRAIDEADGIKPGPFRFWINDDNDDGDLAMEGSDIPGEGSGNASDAVVNGRCDLPDFFPLWLDVGPVLNLVPEEYPLSFVLCHNGEALNFAYSDLTRQQAGSYLTNELSVYGPSFNGPARQAAVEQVTIEGAEISETFLENIAAQADKGILIMEGSEASTLPLTLEIHQGEQLLCEVQMPLRISSIEGFYRWVNLRHLTGGSEDRATDLNQPYNYPDSLCNGKQVIFLHGYNVNEGGAGGTIAEVFKRLYWSGSRAMFTGVSWEGNEDPAGIFFPCAAYYHLDARNAFSIASNLPASFSSLPGSKYMIAHSLGNLAVSLAIKKHGLSVSRYFMLDAAVATEAYQEDTLHPDEMMPSHWQGYSNRLWASEWHLLFPTNDGRRGLTWRDRIGDITNSVNYYSSGEDVLDNNPTNPPPIPLWPDPSGQNAWTYQEMMKGGLPPALTPYMDSHGGWGFNSLHYYWVHYPEDTVDITEEELRLYPFCLPFIPADICSTNGSAVAQEPSVHAKLLSEAIPALSRATGRNPIDACFGGPDNNVDLMDYRTPGFTWPQQDGKWLHGGFKEAAYIFNYGLYEDIATRGVLK